jgi:hypothetical protein
MLLAAQEQRAAGADAVPNAGLQHVIATMPDTIVKVTRRRCATY